MASGLKVDVLQSRDGVSKIILDNMQTGFVIASTTLRNSTRTALSNVAENGSVFGGAFTKVRSDSVIYATATIFGAGYSSGLCGTGLKLDTTWHYGLCYQYDGSWSSTQQTTTIVGQCKWTGIAAGSHTMYFGWKAANGSAGERPFVYLNPNSSDDGRNRQMVSTITIYEIAP